MHNAALDSPLDSKSWDFTWEMMESHDKAANPTDGHCDLFEHSSAVYASGLKAEGRGIGAIFPRRQGTNRRQDVRTCSTWYAIQKV